MFQSGCRYLIVAVYDFRYALYYIRSMTKLPDAVLKRFMEGDHVMRHQPGIWNGIWSDQYIESSFMRYGHGPEGIIGITLQPSTLKRWALGLHICTQLKTDVKNMVSGETEKTVVIHKEEGSSRIKLDGDDRSKIREKLSECVHPFDPESHPENLINVVSGRISPAKVNVDQALKMGSELMTEYLEGWPQTFNKPLKRPVELMSKQHTKIGSVTVYDTSLIYSRVLCLQKVRDINMQDVLSYELAAFPPSMFDEKTGDMRLTSSKSTLKTKLQVEKSSRAVAPPDAFVLDGCAILWVVR